jgi:hypothetical protein
MLLYQRRNLSGGHKPFPSFVDMRDAPSAAVPLESPEREARALGNLFERVELWEIISHPYCYSPATLRLRSRPSGICSAAPSTAPRRPQCPPWRGCPFRPPGAA